MRSSIDRRPKRRALYAGASAALGALALGTLAAAPAAAGVPACATAHLVVWLDTAEGGAAAGTAYHPLTFTNLGESACRLVGYPGVSAVGLTGRQIGRAARRDPTVKPRPVVLAPGASAVAALGIGTAVNHPASTCRPVTAAGLRVYPPNQTRARIVPFPFSTCSRRGPVILSVQAMTTPADSTLG
jgi:hypothetical protein